MSEETEEQQELPESMQEYPFGPWIGLRYGCLFVIGIIGIGWLVWWLTHR